MMNDVEMNRKFVLLITLTFVLVGVLVVVPKVRRVEASGTIYIEADGSVDPPTASITSADNVTYAFTANINESIVVLRSNITIDGNGYTLNGTETGEPTGIAVEYVASNVTIQNVNIMGFGVGISLISTSNNTISGNNITNNADGVFLSGSMNNTISGNNITNNTNGIYIEGSSNNSVYHNYFINNTYQVYVELDNPNAWDDGYPSGGNYWSNFEGRYPGVGDIYRGPYQNETGSDGIWDGPYEIDADNTDRYPLVPEFPAWASILPTLIALTVATAIYKRRLPKTPVH